MLDIKYIKEKPEEVIARLAKKGKDGKEEIEMIRKKVFNPNMKDEILSK